MKYILSFVIVSLLLQACGNSENKTGNAAVQNATDTQAEATGATAAHWYKHYTGTVGNMQVSVNLCSFADVRGPEDEGMFASAGGNCTYNNPAGNSTLVITAIKGDSLFLNETKDGGNSSWVLIRSNAGNVLTGKCTSAGKTIYDIALKEEYREGTYPLRVIEHSEVCAVDWGNGDTSTFKVSLMVLGAGSGIGNADANTLNKETVAVLSGDTVGAKTMEEYATLMAREYVRLYKQHIAEDQASEAEYSSQYNNDVKLRTDCVYNGNGLLEFVFSAYGYMGGMHGDSRSSATCLDMREKKVLQLADIFAAGANISELLEKEAAKVLEVKPGDNIRDVLVVDEIAPSADFTITPGYITFYYSQGEIAGNMYGDITLELSLSKIKDMLTPEIKQRLGI